MALELSFVACASCVVALHRLYVPRFLYSTVPAVLVGLMGTLTALLLQCVTTSRVDFIALLLWNTLGHHCTTGVMFVIEKFME